MNKGRNEDTTDQVRKITEQLEQGVKELFESQKYKDYLTTMSKFHSYSHNNILLIFQQKPDASLIAGYNAWKTEHGRQVRKGSKAIKILAPAPYGVKVNRNKLNPDTNKPVLDENGNPVKENVEVQKLAFKVVNVFDVSDTEGRELPSAGVSELMGDVERYEVFFNGPTKQLFMKYHIRGCIQGITRISGRTSRAAVKKCRLKALHIQCASTME